MTEQESLKTRLHASLQERIDAQKESSALVEPYQWQDDNARQVGEATTQALTQTQFPCAQCGAVLHYAIGTQSTECKYCGHRNAIAHSDVRLQELDLHEALLRLQSAKKLTPEEEDISCPNCAAHFDLEAHTHAGECPFCGTAVVTSTSRTKLIKPKGLLPFAVTADEARASYQQWLKRRWFAPSALKKYARSDAQLNGVYIPYWTYDSDTETSYRGERGEVYYVTQRYTTTINGRRVTRTRQVPKVRWYRASGRTSRHFDDVLVGATRTLPRKITDWLQPWDLKNMVPYTEDYLAGFSSEVYQVDLDEGFSIAQTTMDKVIRNDVRRSIGGDKQRIHRVSTQHSDTTFKHVLLPVWSAGFQFRDKTYRFVVNGRTGKVRGERPYSVVKIAMASIVGIAFGASLLFMMSTSQQFSSTGGGWNTGGGFSVDWGRQPRQSHWPQSPFNDGF